MLALYVWARKSPLPALWTGLGVYVLLMAVTAVLDPGSLQKGLVMKALTLGVLGAGIAAAWREREATDEDQHRRREAGRAARSTGPR